MYSCVYEADKIVGVYVYVCTKPNKLSEGGVCRHVREKCVCIRINNLLKGRSGTSSRSVRGSAYARPLDTPILGAELPLRITVKSIIISANIWTWTQGRLFARDRLPKLSELAPNNILIVVDGVERVTLRVG
jgi:hypothetical protein